VCPAGGDPNDWDKSIEQGGVTLEGFLLGFKHEGVESPNYQALTTRTVEQWRSLLRLFTCNVGKIWGVRPSPDAQAKAPFQIFPRPVGRQSRQKKRR
jgi:hypothetical protein